MPKDTAVKLAPVPAEQVGEAPQPTTQGEIPTLIDLLGFCADRLAVANQRVHGTFAAVIGQPVPGDPPSEAAVTETELGARLAVIARSLGDTITGLNDACDRARL